MNMIEVFFGDKWVRAWYGTWRFSGKFSRWLKVGQFSGVFGWKFLDGPRLSNIDESVVRKWDGKELGT